jgi:hypothetical protein
MKQSFATQKSSKVTYSALANDQWVLAGLNMT